MQNLGGLSKWNIIIIYAQSQTGNRQVPLHGDSVILVSSFFWHLHLPRCLLVIHWIHCFDVAYKQEKKKGRSHGLAQGDTQMSPLDSEKGDFTWIKYHRLLSSQKNTFVEDFYSRLEIKSRLHKAEDWISDFEDKVDENKQLEEQQQKIIIKEN